MSSNCQTPSLINSETPLSSPACLMEECAQQNPVVVATSTESQKNLIAANTNEIGVKVQGHLSVVGESVEEKETSGNGEKKEKKRRSKKSSSRLFLGYHTTGQAVFLINCPMRSSSEDSSTESETET